MSSSLVNSLAKVYDPNPLHSQKPGGRKLSPTGSDKSHTSSSSSLPDAAMRCVESRMDSLSSQMEHMLNMQHSVLTRLDGLSRDLGVVGRDLASIRAEGRGGQGSEVAAACRELRGVMEEASERVERQGRRLEGVEKLVEGMQQVISFVGEVVKSSRLVELLFKEPGRRAGRGGRKAKDNKEKDEKDRAKLSLKGLKVQKKKKPPGSEETSSSNEPVLQEQVDRLNRQNAERSHGNAEAEGIPSETCETSRLPQESSEEVGEMGPCSKRRVTEEDLVKDDLKKSRVEERKEEGVAERAAEGVQPRDAQSDEAKAEADEEGKEGEPTTKEYIIDSSPPPPAPFDHRIVTPKPHQIATYYTINREEVLGGGRFGQVHKCVENSSGLTLAAKIIKARSQKEKEVVKNEIQVMNQLNHANLIQLYAAFESRHDIILVMEYVDGGELFDRIIDENYNLTELDTVLFIRQICEGLQYMHKMYILHLDLKPENILCVSRATNKIKIIDFGLARRYKPREKLRVNFGTPEFLAPEVINYEFVSFPTDMWSLGVITYMLLSGLSPFLGDDDNETLNNILACQWNFEEEEFLDISEEAKDFITRLLVKSKTWRMSAAESLRHPWLSDPSLHYQLHQKKNKCHSTHAPPAES
ncbi:uncharacterized protein mylk4b [Polymixia lowei]